MTRRIAATFVILIGLAGCGGSGSISPATYRAKVNKLCATGNAQIEALPASTTNSVSGLEKLDSIANGALDRIKAITPPSSISSAAHTWLATLEQTSRATGQIIGELKSGQTSKAQALAGRVEALNSQSNADAKAIGLNSCAVNAIPHGS